MIPFPPFTDPAIEVTVKGRCEVERPLEWLLWRIYGFQLRVKKT